MSMDGATSEPTGGAECMTVPLWGGLINTPPGGRAQLGNA